MSGRTLGRPSGPVSVRTPVATIGIRGTIFEGVVGEDAIRIASREAAVGKKVKAKKDEASLIVLRGPGPRTQGDTRPGAIDVTVGASAVTLDRPGLALYAPRVGAPPIGPFPISAAGLQALQSLLRTTAEPGGGGGKKGTARATPCSAPPAWRRHRRRGVLGGKKKKKGDVSSNRNPEATEWRRARHTYALASQLPVPRPTPAPRQEEKAMRIACLGGGPAGLYFAISMKLRDPAHEIDLFERNRTDDTFGWGVVFSDQTVENLMANDPVSRRRHPKRVRPLGRYRGPYPRRDDALVRPRLHRHRPQAASRHPPGAGARARRPAPFRA